MPDSNTFDCDLLHRKIFELKNSNSAKQRIRLCNKIEKLEAEKTELINLITDIRLNRFKGNYITEKIDQYFDKLQKDDLTK